MTPKALPNSANFQNNRSTTFASEFSVKSTDSTRNDTTEVVFSTADNTISYDTKINLMKDGQLGMCFSDLSFPNPIRIFIHTSLSMPHSSLTCI